MDIAQFYEQHMVDCESGLAVRIIMIPRDSFAPHARNGLFEWPALLGLTDIATLTSSEETLETLASLLRPRSGEARAFSGSVLGAPLVFAGPSFELITLDSIATAIESGAGRFMLVALDGASACLGLLAEGLLLFGETNAITRALEAGLARKMREAMGLDGRAPRPGLVG